MEILPVAVSATGECFRLATICNLGFERSMAGVLSEDTRES